MLQVDSWKLAGLASAILGLSACSSGSDSPQQPQPPATTYSVGGTAAGLSGSVVLQLNGGSNLTVSASGAFTFPTNLASGAAYNVTVLTQPVGQTCAITGGSGSVASANISNVAVNCTNNTFSVGGNVTGLSGNVVLQLNGGNNLTVSASGAFTFPTNLTGGTAYAVTVLTQPVGQTCNVGSGTGTIASANISNIAVNCTNIGAGTFTVGGTVNGLSGDVVLRLNGANDLAVNASGAFTFNVPLSSGAAYAVTIGAMPTTQVCGVTGGSGTMGSANVTNVTVTCSNYSVGGSISGLSGAGLVLQLNLANDMTVAAGSTSFTFPSTVSLGGILYNIHIAAQPAGQTCTVVRAVGIVTPTAANVSTAEVACTNNVTDALSGTYKLETVDGVAVTERGFVTFYPDGTYIFAIHSADPDCGANNGNGLEYGVYRWNQATHAFAFVTAAIDTNGGCGIGDNGTLVTGTLIKNANGTLSLDLLDNNGSGDHIMAMVAPVTSTTGTLIGSWGINQAFVTYDSNGHFFNADTRAPVQIVATSPGIEDGCYLLSGSTASGTFTIDLSGSCAVSGVQTAVDTTGAMAGFSAMGTQARVFTVTGDTMQFSVGGGPQLNIPRITTN